MLFFSLFLVFSFLECEYKVYRGAWSLFTPGANSPQLKAKMQRKMGTWSPQKARGTRRAWWRGPGGGGRIFNVEFSFLSFSFLFFFFNVETFRHKPALCLSH